MKAMVILNKVNAYRYHSHQHNHSTPTKTMTLYLMSVYVNFQTAL